VTPDGHDIVFMGNTGRDGGTLYVYDAETNRVTAIAEGYVPISWSNTYMPRWISSDGSRVFFDSASSLVPQDTNGQQDVYEWERDGAGDCRSSEGCIYLLSGGTSTDASYLLDASTSGNDVFFVTRAQLVPQDRDDNFRVYDARVDGMQTLAPQQCSGTGCQGVPPAPPIFATPSSVTFEGVGNFSVLLKTSVKPKSKSLTRAQKLARALTACKKKVRRKPRASCEAKARRQYGARSKAKKSIRERK
jgi:hypothetical protein